MVFISKKHIEKRNSSILARVFSDLANPLILPPLVLGIIGYTVALSFSNIFLLVVISLAFFSFMPGAIALTVSLYHPNGSLDFPNRNMRIPFYGFSILSVFTGSILILGFFNNTMIRLITVIFAITLFGGFIINFRWKISIHTLTLATCGCCLLLAGFTTMMESLPIITGAVLLSIILPLIMWARYHLEIHSIPELIGGLAIGSLLSTLAFIVWNIL